MTPDHAPSSWHQYSSSSAFSFSSYQQPVIHPLYDTALTPARVVSDSSDLSSNMELSNRSFSSSSSPAESSPRRPLPPYYHREHHQHPHPDQYSRSRSQQHPRSHAHPYSQHDHHYQQRRSGPYEGFCHDNGHEPQPRRNPHKHEHQSEHAYPRVCDDRVVDEGWGQHYPPQQHHHHQQHNHEHHHDTHEFISPSQSSPPRERPSYHPYVSYSYSFSHEDNEEEERIDDDYAYDGYYREREDADNIEPIRYEPSSSSSSPLRFSRNNGDATDLRRRHLRTQAIFRSSQHRGGVVVVENERSTTESYDPSDDDATTATTRRRLVRAVGHATADDSGDGGAMDDGRWSSLFGGSTAVPRGGGGGGEAFVVLPDDVVPACRSAAELNDHDVLCGRGGGTNARVGNRRFRRLVHERRPAYLEARRRDKPLLARDIVREIRARGGRFLRRSDDGEGCYYEVGDERAESKTGQALREGLDVRATMRERRRKRARETSAGVGRRSDDADARVRPDDARARAWERPSAVVSRSTAASRAPTVLVADLTDDDRRARNEFEPPKTTTTGTTTTTHYPHRDDDHHNDHDRKVVVLERNESIEVIDVSDDGHDHNKRDDHGETKNHRD